MYKDNGGTIGVLSSVPPPPDIAHISIHIQMTGWKTQHNQNRFSRICALHVKQRKMEETLPYHFQYFYKT